MPQCSARSKVGRTPGVTAASFTGAATVSLPAILRVRFDPQARARAGRLVDIPRAITSSAAASPPCESIAPRRFNFILVETHNNMIGTLRRYSDAGGYGWLTSDDGVDTFCHVSKLRLGNIEFPRAGMRMQYDVVKHRGAKTQASNIRLWASTTTAKALASWC
jgi:cold shock CspA family protein